MSDKVLVDRGLLITLVMYANTHALTLLHERLQAEARMEKDATQANREAYARALEFEQGAADVIERGTALVCRMTHPVSENFGANVVDLGRP